MAGNASTEVSKDKLPEIPTNIKAFIDAGDYEAVDTEVLTKIESSPLDVAFLIGTLRGIVKRKRTRQAQEILELLADPLAKDENVEARGLAARWILKFWPELY